MEQLFGLPAHPLLIHAPVVLIPILAVAAVVGAVRTRWAARLRWWYAAAAAVSFVLLFLARQSGEELDELLGGGVVSTHRDLANATTLLMLLWLVAVIAAAGVAQGRMAAAPKAVGADVANVGPSMLERALFGIAGALAVVTTIWLIRTGHSGADSHWSLVVAS